VQENEDGFFLRLYQCIYDCQQCMIAQLKSYFSSQRFRLSEFYGGLVYCPARPYINLLCEQQGILNCVLSQVYHLAFEFFLLDEAVYKEKLD